MAKGKVARINGNSVFSKCFKYKDTIPFIQKIQTLKNQAYSLPTIRNREILFTNFNK
jgi:hypothetical protein